jgi:site-specific recombinase XerD
MEFTFLMKDVLKSPSKRKKARFAWTLDENKFLSLGDVRKLRKYCKKDRKQALKEGIGTGVRNWFMVELGLNAGLRVKEMANLKCSDLLIEKDQFSVIAIGKRCSVPL